MKSLDRLKCISIFRSIEFYFHECIWFVWFGQISVERLIHNRPPFAVIFSPSASLPLFELNTNPLLLLLQKVFLFDFNVGSVHSVWKCSSIDGDRVGINLERSASREALRTGAAAFNEYDCAPVTPSVWGDPNFSWTFLLSKISPLRQSNLLVAINNCELRFQKDAEKTRKKFVFKQKNNSRKEITVDIFDFEASDLLCIVHRWIHWMFISMWKWFIRSESILFVKGFNRIEILRWIQIVISDFIRILNEKKLHLLEGNSFVIIEDFLNKRSV